MPSSWDLAMACDGARLGHSLHLPSPVNHRQLCKRYIQAWEKRHGERLSTCRRWLKRHRTRQPVPQLEGGGPVKNIQGLLIRYTLEQKEDGQSEIRRKIWNGKNEWVDMEHDNLKDWKNGSTLLLGGDKFASSTTGNEKTKTVTVLWVRHCFGCHNYKSKHLTWAGQFMYRLFDQTSLCTTDGNHMETLVTRAQELKKQVAKACEANVTYKYYSSILPRAMMTAKLVRRVIANNATAENLLTGVKYLKDLQCIEGAAKPPSQQGTAEPEPQGDAIQRMWYVSEQFNAYEKYPPTKIAAFLGLLVCSPVILLHMIVTCCRDVRAYNHLIKRRNKENTTNIKFNEGLNRVKQGDSDKYVEYLNEMFSKHSFSNKAPMAVQGQAPTTYDEPNLMTWEQKVLPLLVNKVKKDANEVHLIVSHGKTMTRYMDELAGIRKRKS